MDDDPTDYDLGLVAAQKVAGEGVVIGWIVIVEHVDANGIPYVSHISGTGDSEIRDNGGHRLTAHRITGLLSTVERWIDIHERRWIEKRFADPDEDDEEES